MINEQFMRRFISIQMTCLLTTPSQVSRQKYWQVL